MAMSMEGQIFDEPHERSLRSRESETTARTNADGANRQTSPKGTRAVTDQTLCRGILRRGPGGQQGVYPKGRRPEWEGKANDPPQPGSAIGQLRAGRHGC